MIRTSTTVTTSIGTKQPLLTNYSGSLPILDNTNNKNKQIFTTSPINSSIYNNSSDALDQNNGNIMLSLDGSYLNNVYTKSDSDARYAGKAIDGTKTNISLDTKYRIQSDGTNFYIQRFDNDGVIETDVGKMLYILLGIPIHTSSIFMNGIDILGNLSNTVAPYFLTNYQPIFTASSPLTLNTTSNTLSIDLTPYSTTSAADLRYQKIFTASLPLSLNSITNALSIDLSTYPKYLLLIYHYH